MVLRKCEICNYTTQSKFNFDKHLQTKKHLHKMTQISKNEQKNVEKCGKNVGKSSDLILETTKMTEKSPQKSSDLICVFCSKNFSRLDSLKRHISVCKLNFNIFCIHKDPQGSKNVEKSSDFQCHFCHNTYQTKRGLNKHIKNCLTREKDLQNKLLQKDLEREQAVNREKERTIEIAKKSKQVINNINTTNKTINYLNNTYGDMIAIEQFLYNLEHTEQLTQEEREKLLISFKDSGIELFARSFSHIMKENCRRQLLKEGLPDMGLIPLYCSDGNLRSHKEKGDQGWNTKYDDHNLNKMINISSSQVFQSYRKPLVIFGKDRNKVFKQLKKDNHSKNEKKKEIRNN